MWYISNSNIWHNYSISTTQVVSTMQVASIIFVSSINNFFLLYQLTIVTNISTRPTSYSCCQFFVLSNLSTTLYDLDLAHIVYNNHINTSWLSFSGYRAEKSVFWDGLKKLSVLDPKMNRHFCVNSTVVHANVNVNKDKLWTIYYF